MGKLSQFQKDQIPEIIKQGKSVSQVAKEFGITHQRVSQICKEAGVSPTFASNRIKKNEAKNEIKKQKIYFKKARNVKIIADYLAGIKTIQIAETYGLGRSGILRIVKKHNSELVRPTRRSGFLREKLLEFIKMFPGISGTDLANNLKSRSVWASLKRLEEAGLVRSESKVGNTKYWFVV